MGEQHERHSHKRYLGDGVYADLDDRGIVLTTENGISVTNVIVLEPQVLLALEKFIGSLNAFDIIGRYS